jgi:hypothetical protein
MLPAHPSIPPNPLASQPQPREARVPSILSHLKQAGKNYDCQGIAHRQ